MCILTGGVLDLRMKLEYLKSLQVLDKELAEIQLSEELKSITLQAEEYKVLGYLKRTPL